MKVSANKLKQEAQALYYDLRRQGLSHPVAMAAVVEKIILLLAQPAPAPAGED